ncbi:hypothetical protein TVAG_212230 [Trichomonas vaginalis G3]|uniref:BTB domain-containing protein n=1 Tax=Trichomonas vaginalis (strain ATCC PRA-98 / G3) TaxID=412133 RepID=A2E2L3_TRIV3|nr:protein ubiquitination [Trichomonas vaginalis G3]EAY13041.1 hypothetical protein TVAG_212230 [Trichomonas vaginalis G3]KAI5548230.1 protein ubiquitination [Trichomonas vaginalis G3]|eukprot:XP_001325264.1 hypothetical protein [Trichomonas vaginalis G3]
MTTLQIRIPFNPTLDTMKEFQDVVLVSPYHKVEYKANRLKLAQLSPYFRRKFNEIKPEPGNVLRFQLEKDPKNATQVVLDGFQTFKLTINPDIAPALLCVSSIYELPHYCQFAIEVIQKAIVANSPYKTISRYLSEFQEYGIVEHVDKLIPYFAQYLIDAIARPEIADHSLDELLDLITDGRVLSKLILYIIKERNFKLATSAILKTFDTFYDKHPNMSADEKESFMDNEIINWDQPDTFQYLTKFKCLWLGYKKARENFKKIFVNRRKIINEFKPDESNPKQMVKRWYALSLIKDIHESDPSQDNENYNTIKFITTLGGVAKQLDPEKFGLINPDPKVIPCGDQILDDNYKHSNIFMKNEKIFCAIGNDKHAVVDFGSEVYASSIVLDFEIAARIRKIGDISQYFPHPKSVEITFFSGQKQTHSQKYDVKSRIFTIKQVNRAFTKIVISPSNKAATFKLKNVEIVGHFTN